VTVRVVGDATYGRRVAGIGLSGVRVRGVRAAGSRWSRSQVTTLVKICVISFCITLIVALSIPASSGPQVHLTTAREGDTFSGAGLLPGSDPLAGEVPPDGITARGGGPGPLGAVGGAPTPSAGPYGLRDTSGLTSSGIPLRAQQAYTHAAAELARTDPTCKLPWTILAGIGRVESNHGRFGGSQVQADGRVAPPILGISLDGSRAGTATIRDSDGGRYDGDTGFDRAVGPMQFLPGTWAGYGADADRDGTANPQDIDDAALGAGRYLCAGSATFATQQGRWSAVYRYNHSDSYVQLVLSLADSYASGTVATFPPPPPNADRPGGDQATPPGPPPAIPPPPTTPPAPTPPTTGPKPTPTPTQTKTPGSTPTGEPTTTPTTTPTTSPTTSPTTGPTTPTETPTETPTTAPTSPTQTPTPTPSQTPSCGATETPVPTPTGTVTCTPTVTPTAATTTTADSSETSSATGSATESATGTSTATP